MGEERGERKVAKGECHKGRVEMGSARKGRSSRILGSQRDTVPLPGCVTLGP